MTGKAHVSKLALKWFFRLPKLVSEQYVARTNITMEDVAGFVEKTGNCLRNERLYKEQRRYVTLEQIVDGDQSIKRCFCVH
jgi:hypothetical protein